MAQVFLDLKGRLIEFHGVLGQDDRPGEPAKADWGPLFAAAGLDHTTFHKEAVLHWESPVAYDQRATWRGPLPDRPDLTVWVEAAARAGKPVYFQVIGDWGRPNRLYSSAGTRPFGLVDSFSLALLGLALVGGALLARRNLRLGRADARGARRVGLFLLACFLLFWLCTADHSRSFQVEVALVSGALGLGLFCMAPYWLAYLALEPYVRRRWPWRITSWGRLLAGQLRDPLVGRDLLLGAAFGVLLIGCSRVENGLPGWLGLPPSVPLVQHTYAFTPLVPARIFIALFLGITDALSWFFLLFLLVLLCRKEWLAVAGLFLVAFAYTFLDGMLWRNSAPMAAVAVTSLGVGVALFVMQRYGLLALATGISLNFVLFHSPVTYDLTTWYAGCTVSTVLIVVAFVVYAFVISLGGRPILGKGFFGEE
jgi:serine/threonine-protein kinase